METVEPILVNNFIMTVSVGASNPWIKDITMLSKCIILS